jgi:hypothetical protein
MFCDHEQRRHGPGKLYFVDECGEVFVYTYDKSSAPGSNPEFWDKTRII